MAPLMRDVRTRLTGTVLVCLVLAAVAAAQETRGTLTGIVTDGKGGVVPGATVTVTNRATNTSTNTTTTSEGAYTAPFLQPGTYTVSVEASGFKRLVHPDVEVRVGDRLALDLVLEPGAVQETVTISAGNAPLVEVATANFGQVIDRRRVSELPLADGNPFALTRLAPGVSVFGSGFTGAGTQPFSTTDPSSISTNGAAGSSPRRMRCRSSR
jgi:hypothetical protein